MSTITYYWQGSNVSTVTLQDSATPEQQTAALQSALDAVAGNVGGKVILSEGLFRIAGTGKAADGGLRIGSETTFEGAGSGLTVLKLADGQPGVTGLVRTDLGRMAQDGTLETTHNVTVRSLTLDGNRDKTTGATDGFYSGPKPGTQQFDTNITLDGVEIRSMSRYGFDPHEGTKGLQLINCVAHHNTYDGFTIDGCEDVSIINARAYANGRHGINVVTGSENVSIIDSHVTSNAGNGITVQTGDNEIRAFTSGILISGGLIESNGRAGIDAHQMAGLTVENVAFGWNGRDAISLAGVDGASISGNSFQATASGYKSVKVGGYLQDFADADVINDRYVTSKSIVVDGIPVRDGTIPMGATAWSYEVSKGDNVISGSEARDVISAGGGDDRVEGNGGTDLLYGNDGADFINGGYGDDVMHGGWGDDDLFGGSAFDVLFGGDGTDRLDGGAGNDTLNGGTGSDRIVTGSGSDRVAFNANWGNDVIVDFYRGRDKVAFEGITGLKAFSDLSIQATAVGADVAFSGHHILLLGIGAQQLTASDFIFS